jgi:hypothetical protein
MGTTDLRARSLFSAPPNAQNIWHGVDIASVSTHPEHVFDEAVRAEQAAQVRVQFVGDESTGGLMIRR